MTEVNEKSKRILTLDIIRGFAIIGVLGFHILDVVYDYEGVIDNGPPIPFYILVFILASFGTLYTVFIIISAIGNTFSMYSTWERIVQDDPNDPNLIKIAHKTLLKAQLIRGGMIAVLGYFCTVILNTLLLDSLIGKDWEEIKNSMISAITHNEILTTIGIGIMISSAIYLKLKKTGKNTAQIKKSLLIIAFIFVFLRPLIGALFKTIPGYWNSVDMKWNNPADIWSENHNIGMLIVYIIISPFHIGWFPLLPNIALMFIGIYIGIDIKSNDNKITKKLLAELLKLAGLFIIIGIVDIVLIKDRFMKDMLIPTAGALVLIVFLLYLFEVRGKANKAAKKLKFVLFFGNSSLSIFILQWLMFFPFLIAHKIYNSIHGVSDKFIDGVVYNGGLTGYDTLALFLSGIFFYFILLKGWSKFNYVGSFEWMTAKLMSKKDIDLRFDLDKIESIISEEDGEKIYTRAEQFLLYFFQFISMVLVVASQLF